MNCVCNHDSPDEKCLRFLLPSLKHLSAHEQRLFRLAAACSASGQCVRSVQNGAPSNTTNQHASAAQHSDKRAVAIRVPTDNNRRLNSRGEHSNSTCQQNETGEMATSDFAVCRCNATPCCSCKLFVPRKHFPAPLLQQTYRKWKSTMDVNFRLRLLRGHRSVIYIQPIGTFPDFVVAGGFFELLRSYAQAFFHGMTVRLLETLPAAEGDWGVRSRTHAVTGQRQILVGDVHRGLAKQMPRGACCVVGVTWTDLYPSEDLNFVLGEALFSKRVAAICFGHYDPKGSGDGAPPDGTSDDIVWQTIKVISHELCHVFGLAHCVFFECLMNESVSRHEAMSQPNFLCPVCLYKLVKCTRSDVTARYRQLLQFYRSLPGGGNRTRSAVEWLQYVLQYLDDS